MLRQRILTAVVLLLVLLALLFSGSAVLFLAFVLAAFVAAALEWTRLSNIHSLSQRYLFVFALFLCLLLSTVISNVPGASVLQASVAVAPALLVYAIPAAVMFWLAAFVLVLTFPAWQSRASQPLSRTLAGAALLWFAWLAIVYLMSLAKGPALLLYVIIVVAASDVGAYFTGKAFGRRKLAPSASPGKSWEGFFGGCAASVVVAGIALQLDTFSTYSPVPFLAVSLVVALASVVGDLFESVAKRIANVKDSGSLLPGHGGVLDRVDGLVAALPIFVCAHWLLDW